MGPMKDLVFFPTETMGIIKIRHCVGNSVLKMTVSAELQKVRHPGILDARKYFGFMDLAENF